MLSMKRKVINIRAPHAPLLQMKVQAVEGVKEAPQGHQRDQEAVTLRQHHSSRGVGLIKTTQIVITIISHWEAHHHGTHIITINHR